jgi:ribosomal protein L12E/L44/L45/RPP1/RPP2
MKVSVKHLTSLRNELSTRRDLLALFSRLGVKISMQRLDTLVKNLQTHKSIYEKNS